MSDGTSDPNTVDAPKADDPRDQAKAMDNVDKDGRMLPADGTPLIIAVGAAGARELIEADLTKKGYIPGKDAWFVC